MRDLDFLVIVVLALLVVFLAFCSSTKGKRVELSAPAISKSDVSGG